MQCAASAQAATSRMAGAHRVASATIPSWRVSESRRMLVCRAVAQNGDGNGEPYNNIVSGLSSRRGIRLSLFHPYKSLPPDGQIIPRKEEMCDPEKSRCKTHTYVYEEKCHACHGTGHARNAFHRSGRAKLSVCLHCQGLGYVRCTTTQLPIEISAKLDVSEHTMLRNFQSETDLRASSQASPAPTP